MCCAKSWFVVLLPMKKADAAGTDALQPNARKAGGSNEPCDGTDPVPAHADQDEALCPSAARL